MLSFCIGARQYQTCVRNNADRIARLACVGKICSCIVGLVRASVKNPDAPQRLRFSGRPASPLPRAKCVVAGPVPGRKSILPHAVEQHLDLGTPPDVRRIRARAIPQGISLPAAPRIAAAHAPARACRLYGLRQRAQGRVNGVASRQCTHCDREIRVAFFGANIRVGPQGMVQRLVGCLLPGRQRDRRSTRICLASPSSVRSHEPGAPMRPSGRII